MIVAVAVAVVVAIASIEGHEASLADTAMAMKTAETGTRPSPLASGSELRVFA